MKIEKICISIFITLVLSLCSAQYSPYFITRFEHLDALLTHSYYKTGFLSSEIKDPIHRMLTDEIQELCINVFTATFFSLLEDETTENDFEEKIRKINKENTNILFLAYNVSFRNVKNQKWKMFSCYISEEISLYISSTFIIDESFYVFYSLSEDINKQMLGLVERSSTLIDVFPNKMYYDYRRELQEYSDMLEKKKAYFDGLGINESRLCGSAYKHAISRNNWDFTAYILEVNTTISPYSNVSNEPVLSVRVPILTCVLKRIKAIYKIIYYLTPNFTNDNIFVLDPVKSFYKLAKCLDNVPPFYERHPLVVIFTSDTAH